MEHKFDIGIDMHDLGICATFSNDLGTIATLLYNITLNDLKLYMTIRSRLRCLLKTHMSDVK